ncbi:MAG: GTP-binding protein [Acidiferrobacterales bacterium]
MSFIDQEVSTATAVSVITGFLGSGKTTVLNYLLAHPDMDQTAVLINEFGEVGLDHLVVRKLDENVVLLQSGCICCTVRGQLVDGLRELYMKRLAGTVPDFNRVAIETTGLADPLPIITCLMRDPLFKHVYRLDGLITTVDAVHGSDQLDDHEEAVRQAAVADRLIVTKMDLTKAPDLDRLHERLHKLNPGATIISSEFGQVPPQRLFDSGLFDPKTKSVDVQHWLKEEAYESTGNHLHEHGDHVDVNRHDEHIASFCLVLDEPIEWQAFKEWYEALAEKKGDYVLRVKGIVNIQGEQEPFVIQCVQSTQYTPARLPSWPGDDRRSKIVFITRDLERQEVEQSLRACVERGASGVSVAASPALIGSSSPHPREPGERWLNDAELSRLFGALLDEADTVAANAIRLMFLTGTRGDELLGARWDQFDLGRGLWTKPTLVLGNSMPRKVVLSLPARALLRHMRAGDVAGRFLFPGDASDEPRTSIESSWQRAAAAAGITAATLVDLHPTLAKNLFDGLSPPLLCRLLGLPPESAVDCQ